MPIHDWTRVNPGIFHHFHGAWIFQIADALNNGVLPESYYAIGEQVSGQFTPDVLTLTLDKPEGRDFGELPPGTTALLTASPKVRFTAEAERRRYSRRQKAIVIRHSTNDKVVAFLEIVSSGNKSSRRALRQFVRKACAILEKGYHLTLADLYPPGRLDPHGIHTAIWEEIESPSQPLPLDKPLTLAAYASGPTIMSFVEPVDKGDVLPDMPLFLDPDYYVNVPFEATYQAAYREVPKRWRNVLEAT